jgi:hypothetical protein
MRHFLSHQVQARSGAGFRDAQSKSNATNARLNPTIVRQSFFGCLVFVFLLSSLPLPLPAQVPVPTSRGDNTRSGANTNETLLTPENVNKNSFGRLFKIPIDPDPQFPYATTILAQPLYMPNVNIPGQGTHNVVYVATLADSVYAIDADNGSILWYASMLNGGTTAFGSNLPCGFGGYKQEGIVSTPVIDSTTNIMYLVAKTVLNGVVRHDIHALDITTGSDVMTPVQIVAQSTSNSNNVYNKPVVTNFTSLHQKNRPGLLLLNGVLYLGFGSNGCNDNNSGWVLSYEESSLSQLGVFNTSPAYGLTSVWQSGNGLAADEAGYIYAETAEASNTLAVPNGQFDIPNGGQTYCNTVLKLGPDLSVADYFTPWDVSTLNSSDFDMSSTGALVLPDLPGPYPHELIAGGKQGYVYVLNRDNLGMWSSVSDQIIQEISLEPDTQNDVLFGGSAYWNNTVYFAPDASPVRAFPLQSNGLLGTQVKTKQNYTGSHSPSISANGNTNGILWVLSGGLNAFNACIAPNCQNEFAPMQLLYNTNQATGQRDQLPTIGHFVTQTVANGKVYVATQSYLVAYGLFESVSVIAGNGQTGMVGQPLANPIQIQATNPYTGQADTGTTVTFSSNCKPVGPTCGSFNPPSAVTDANGMASTIFTLPAKVGTYTITFSGIGFSNATATATASGGVPTKVIAYGGAGQHDSFGNTIGVTPGTKALIAQVQDANKNPVNGVTVYFTATKGGIPNPASAVTATNANGISGMATTNLQLPTTTATVIVTACLNQPCTGAKITFAEYAVAPVNTGISITGGNNQTGAVGTQLPQALSVLVVDQFGNPVSGNNVTFSDNGAGGTFSNGNTAPTGANGVATNSYTFSHTATTVSINATATGISNPAVFTETSVPGPAANIAITGGNNQTAPNGTQLPQLLTVVVTDQYNNPVPGVSVGFSDGGAGGIFSNPNPTTTGANGTASQIYTLPQVAGETVHISATAAGVASPAVFTEYCQ